MSKNNKAELTDWQKIKERGYSALHILVKNEHKELLEAEAEKEGVELTVYVRGLLLGKENRILKRKSQKVVINGRE